MKLTQREMEVGHCVAEGLGRQTIADRLNVSLSSIDKHLRVLKDKFEAANHADLALRLGAYLAGDGAPTTGALDRKPSDTAPAEAPPLPYEEAATFEALFPRMAPRLRPFGITHVTYSHIRLGPDPGGITHLNTRWNFPPQVAFDFSIPPAENFAFKHAAQSWAPAPLDLSALMASEIYDFLPQNIREQNDAFVAAGLVRGVTYVLPAIAPTDRLVVSVLLQDVSASDFAQFLAAQLPAVQVALMDFRHAHVALARPTIELPPDVAAALAHLGDGRSSDEIGGAMGISRRAVDRLLQTAREALAASTNAGALATWLRDRLSPDLPF
ncbi:MAG: LuxR C-terminal-related transcriptional regulator [Shimia sp.]